MCCGSTLFPTPALILWEIDGRVRCGDSDEVAPLGTDAWETRTYDRRTLEDRRTPVEDKDRFYSPEEKLANATQEAKDVGVEDHASVIISHCGLELVDPYAGVYREDFSLQSLQTFGGKSARMCKK